MGDFFDKLGENLEKERKERMKKTGVGVDPEASGNALREALKRHRDIMRMEYVYPDLTGKEKEGFLKKLANVLTGGAAKLFSAVTSGFIGFWDGIVLLIVNALLAILGYQWGKELGFLYMTEMSQPVEQAMDIINTIWNFIIWILRKIVFLTWSGLKIIAPPLQYVEKFFKERA